MQWLMFQMSSVGPMLGQAHVFYKYGPDHHPREKLEVGIERYVRQANRLYNVMDLHLADREWFAAGEYTIADMAVFPWLRMPAFHGVEIDEYPNVKRWRDKIARAARGAARAGGAQVRTTASSSTPTRNGTSSSAPRSSRAATPSGNIVRRR